MRFIIILAVVAVCSAQLELDAPPCTAGPEDDMESDPIFKQCNSIFRNWVVYRWDLSEDQVKAVGAKKVGDHMGSQLLVQISPQVCMMVPIANQRRGPPKLGAFCKLEGTCPIPSMYSKC